MAIERVAAWAATRVDVQALYLVGSHARGGAGQHSDVDLVVVCDDPRAYVRTGAWLEELGGATLIRTRQWGDLTERRLRLQGLEPEVDLGFVAPTWDPPAPLRRERREILRRPSSEV